MALSLNGDGTAIIAINPGPMLGSKMVKEGFGVAGGDIRIGADILTRVALADDFETASDKYLDNGQGQFACPHQDALNPLKADKIVGIIDTVLAKITSSGGNYLWFQRSISNELTTHKLQAIAET